MRVVITVTPLSVYMHVTSFLCILGQMYSSLSSSSPSTPPDEAGAQNGSGSGPAQGSASSRRRPNQPQPSSLAKSAPVLGQENEEEFVCYQTMMRHFSERRRRKPALAHERLREFNGRMRRKVGQVDDEEEEDARDKKKEKEQAPGNTIEDWR